MNYKYFLSLMAAGVIALAPSRGRSTRLPQHNLVSDKPAAATADHTDPSLLNPGELRSSRAVHFGLG